MDTAANYLFALAVGLVAGWLMRGIVYRAELRSHIEAANAMQGQMEAMRKRMLHVASLNLPLAPLVVWEDEPKLQSLPNWRNVDAPEDDPSRMN